MSTIMIIKIFKVTRNGVFKITLCEKGIELYQSKNWHLSSTTRGVKYLMRKVRKKPFKRRNIIFHRELLKITDSKLQVDHINHDGLDNRICNLRVATPLENQRNKRKIKKASSAYKGVFFTKQDQVWNASIRHSGKRNYLGRFKTEEEAALAYNEAAKIHFGEFANLNIVE